MVGTWRRPHLGKIGPWVAVGIFCLVVYEDLREVPCYMLVHLHQSHGSLSIMFMSCKMYFVVVVVVVGNWTELNWSQSRLNFELKNLKSSRTVPALVHSCKFCIKKDPVGNWGAAPADPPVAPALHGPFSTNHIADKLFLFAGSFSLLWATS